MTSDNPFLARPISFEMIFFLMNILLLCRYQNSLILGMPKLSTPFCHLAMMQFKMQEVGCQGPASRDPLTPQTLGITNELSQVNS